MHLEITWTKKAMRLPEEVRKEIVRRLEMLQRYFPEMTPRMRVGLTRLYDGLAYQSDSGNVRLLLDVHRSRKKGWQYPTYWTIGHEFMHLAQFNSKGIPSGERACDVHALSRLPPKLIDEAPSYLVISKRLRELWGSEMARLSHDLACEALRRRRKGLRNYACWWEDEFERRVEELVR
ncbi:MAG: hypothetical protein JW880_08590 [Candidatus Thermoplasmatota archaeon]|nr:hypothetical protein [Candidatus Thermoplasmatota archaeon]